MRNLAFYLLSMVATFVCSAEPSFPEPIAYREVVCHVESAIQRVDPDTTRVLILKNDGVLDLAKLEHAANLNTLRVYGGQLEGLPSLRRLKQLKEIQFVGCGLTNIEWIAELRQLEHISFALNDIQEIPSLTGMKNLKILDLCWNNIQNLNGGVFPTLPTLQRVDLRGNPLLEESVNRMLEAIGPATRLLTGDATSHNADPSTRNLQVRSRWLIAQYSSGYRLARYKEMAGPQFEPHTADDVVEAVKVLDELGDDSYLADFATVIACYCQWAAEMNPPGWPIAGKYLDTETGEIHIETSHGYLLEKFCQATELEQAGDQITSNFLGDYIASRRGEFGPSRILSNYVEQWLSRCR